MRIRSAATTARTTALRLSVSLLAGAAILMSVAPSASAASRVDVSPARSAFLGDTAPGRSLMAAAPGPRRGSLLSVAGTFRPKGSPYEWSLALVRLHDRFGLAVEARSDLSGSAQVYQWRFHLPLGNASIGPGLHTAGLHTGTALGSFGRINLAFSSARRLQVTRDRCPANHALLFAYHDRLGTLKGSFHFTPNEGDLPSVQVGHMHALAERDMATGATCPRPGPPPAPSCRSPKAMKLTDAAQHAHVFGFAGSNALDVNVVDRVGPAIVDRTIEAFSPNRVVTLRKTRLVIDASQLSPLLSGSLTLQVTGGSVGIGSGATCVRRTETAVWLSDTLTAHFDSGAIDLTGAAVHARVRWRTRH
jgi:hypothetical protein